MLPKGVTRMLEVFLALIGLAVTLPVFLIVSTLIKLDSPGPILARQQFLGTNGRVCVIYTFRVTSVDSTGQPQVSRLGRHLRATRLDELPMLLSLLMNEVSFFGPRQQRP